MGLAAGRKAYRGAEKRRGGAADSAFIANFAVLPLGRGHIYNKV
ncbi:hypothetical protein HMPREF9136_0411 [Prevotella dentalis DSM 3688]|uniref:Uncharacterized protein n=1 Tax=Prevotella dentalis (strain ATCC 49559 / DSM 3688 / JCM 13448 / NCTC 12043 / ES 2772) TaxID=908937 RepID=F9D0N3_PREDD|nr:hypothetical protein HMPREF9136_0411 [Prevotella dentalis DSM 3688]